MISIKSLQRYPVKGLSPELLPDVTLEQGQTFPADRAFAIENGPSGFDPQAPAWFAKIRFLCWMKNPKLARLASRYDEAAGTLTLRDGNSAVTGDLSTPEGRNAIEDFLSSYMGDEKRGPLKILSAPGHSFSDVAKKVVSFINLASVEEIGREAGAEINPFRFRGNVHVAGLDLWAEATWPGRRFRVGPEAEFKAVKTIPRCLATHVDPARGVRDVDVMGTIRTLRGDLDCGVYAQVVRPGTIRTGDEIVLL